MVATTFPVLAFQQLRNDLVAPLSYRRLTAIPPDAAAVTIDIERPILHVQVDLPDAETAARDQRAPEVEDPDRHPWPED